MSKIIGVVNHNNNIGAELQDKSLKIDVVLTSSGPQGKSAYQTWLDLGNTGSAQDFIDSLGVTKSTSYVHVQALPGVTWHINHKLDKFPSVTVVDTGGNVILGSVVYVDSNNLSITFSNVFSGSAYLN